MAAATAASARDAKYERIWDDFKAKDKKWARQTSECEAGGDRNIHGGGGSYHGAFQFMKSTWKNAPKSIGQRPAQLLLEDAGGRRGAAEEARRRRALARLRLAPPDWVRPL